MELTLIQSSRRSGLPTVAGLIMVPVAVALAIWAGPIPFGAAAILGLLLSLFDVSHVWIIGNTKKKWVFPLALFLVHGIFLMTALGLHALFLSPPSSNTVSLPRFGQKFVDPEGDFELTGPADWTYTPLITKDGKGVRIYPPRDQALGTVSEITVLISRMETTPKSEERFVLSMAEAMNRSQERVGRDKAHFSLESRSSVLLDGAPGVISVLEAKTFWIPLQQVSLYGVKAGNKFVSISATGLKAHSQMAEVICQGLFKTLKISGGKLSN